MTESCVWDGQSHFGVCSVSSENCKYWDECVDMLTKDYDAPAVAFGLHNKKFKEGLKLFYFL